MNFNCIANPEYIPQIMKYMRENSAKIGKKVEAAIDGGTQVTRTFVNRAGEQIAHSTTTIKGTGEKRNISTKLETLNGMSKETNHDMKLFNGYFYHDNGKTILPYDASTRTVVKNSDGLVAQETLRNFKFHTESLQKTKPKNGMQSFVLKDVSDNDMSRLKEGDILEFLHLSQQGVPIKGYSRKSLTRNIIENERGQYKPMWIEEDWGAVKEINKKPARMTPLEEGDPNIFANGITLS